MYVYRGPRTIYHSLYLLGAWVFFNDNDYQVHLVPFFSTSFGKPEPWYLVKAWWVINQVAFGSYLVTWFSGNLLWTNNAPLNTPTIALMTDEFAFLKLTTTVFSSIFLYPSPNRSCCGTQQFLMQVMLAPPYDSSTVLTFLNGKRYFLQQT